MSQRVISSEVVAQAWRSLGHLWRERIFTPLVTLWTFSARHAQERDLTSFYDALLRGMAYHRIPERPERSEPRVRKHRPRNCRLMPQPRNKSQKDFLTDGD